MPSGREQVLADLFAAMRLYVAMAAAVLTLAAWWLLGDLDEA